MDIPDVSEFIPPPPKIYNLRDYAEFDGKTLVVYKVTLHGTKDVKWITAQCKFWLEDETQDEIPYFVLRTGAEEIVNTLLYVQDKLPLKIRLLKSGRAWYIRSSV